MLGKNVRVFFTSHIYSGIVALLLLATFFFIDVAGIDQVKGIIFSTVFFPLGVSIFAWRTRVFLGPVYILTLFFLGATLFLSNLASAVLYFVGNSPFLVGLIVLVLTLLPLFFVTRLLRFGIFLRLVNSKNLVAKLFAAVVIGMVSAILSAVLSYAAILLLVKF